MSIGPITNNYLQSILSPLQNQGGLSASNSSSLSPSPDNSGLSPFAQVLTALQQLQQSNPTKYQQVTEQIATNLQTAAQTAQSQGNSVAANQLNQLATDFTNASGSGQLPNVQDLAQAAAGHHHHHHHFNSGSSDSASSSSSSGNAGSTASLSSAFQTNAALNPASIILNVLDGARTGS